MHTLQTTELVTIKNELLRLRADMRRVEALAATKEDIDALKNALRHNTNAVSESVDATHLLLERLTQKVEGDSWYVSESLRKLHNKFGISEKSIHKGRKQTKRRGLLSWLFEIEH